MHANIAGFVASAQRFLCENGPWQNRKDISLLQHLSAELAAAETLLPQIPPDKALLLAMLQTSESSPQRHEAIKAIFAAAFLNSPTSDFIKVAGLLPRIEVEKNLLPFIYDPGSRGSFACYLAGKLSIHLAPEAFPYFLRARKWSQSDLFNLAFLARPEEIASLCSQLESIASAQTKPVDKELFDEFRYILFNQNAKEPLMPDFVPTETVNQTPVPVISATSPAVTVIEEGAKKPVVTSRKAELSKPVINNQPVKGNNAVSDNIPVFKLLSVVILLLVVILFWSLTLFSDQESVSIKNLANAKIPGFWIDAVAQKPVTAKFLAADKDYRMGELFLTRDQFTEALTLFEDAVAIDPEHVQAHFRIGYCRMRTQDYPGAIKALNLTLKKNSTFKLANLYLARIALEQNDSALAENFYAAEFAINKEPSAAMEYAKYLEQHGQKAKAQVIIGELQRLYPDRTFILSKSAGLTSGKAVEP